MKNHLLGSIKDIRNAVVDAGHSSLFNDHFYNGCTLLPVLMATGR